MQVIIHKLYRSKSSKTTHKDFCYISDKNQNDSINFIILTLCLYYYIGALCFQNLDITKE